MAGGLVDQNSKHLSSTEILHSLMTGQWRTLEGKLPEAVMGLRGATLNNQVFMTGKYDKNKDWTTNYQMQMVVNRLGIWLRRIYIFQEERMRRENTMGRENTIITQ